MRVAEAIELDEHTARELRVLAKGRRVEARLQQRARIILLAANGMQNKDIAVEVDLDRRQVAQWRQRFLEGGIDALRKDAPRSGRPATIATQMESRIVQATLHARQSTPLTGARARWPRTWHRRHDSAPRLAEQWP